jgi:hypothetical protein
VNRLFVGVKLAEGGLLGKVPVDKPDGSIDLVLAESATD